MIEPPGITLTMSTITITITMKSIEAITAVTSALNPVGIVSLQTTILLAQMPCMKPTVREMAKEASNSNVPQENNQNAETTDSHSISL